jgi:hypothetical protein
MLTMGAFVVSAYSVSCSVSEMKLYLEISVPLPENVKYVSVVFGILSPIG